MLIPTSSTLIGWEGFKEPFMHSQTVWDPQNIKNRCTLYGNKAVARYPWERPECIDSKCVPLCPKW